jgi:RNA polymerase sigma-70 factor (ECF subfamily)
LRVALTSAIDELPPDHRTAVLLRDVEGLSHLQIADVLGVSVPTVKSRVHRARLLLRKQLGAALTTSDATTAARSDA